MEGGRRRGRERDQPCPDRSLTWHRSGTERAKALRGTAPPAQAIANPTGRPDGQLYGRTLPTQSQRSVALHKQSYTYVFSRLQSHTHRTQLQRTFCEGLHGAPPAEPNTAFYTELDERLLLQHNTLAALRDKARAQEAAIGAAAAGARAGPGGGAAAAGAGGSAAGWCGCGAGQQGGLEGLGAGPEAVQAGAADAVDTVALRRAVNSSLTSQMEFFTRCMAQYVLEGDRQQQHGGGGAGGAWCTRCSCATCDCPCRTADRQMRGLLHGVRHVTPC